MGRLIETHYAVVSVTMVMCTLPKKETYILISVGNWS